ncbi:hypothetical protein D3C81_1322760 [compost metagenome]
MVPHGLIAIFRDRERYARQRVFKGYTTLKGFGAYRVFRGVIQQALRQCDTAMGREHIDTECRITLEQLLRGRCKFVGILTDVFAVDHRTGFVGLERVWPKGTARLETGWRRGEATGVSRNGAVGITGLFRADGGQAITEFCRFIRGDCRVCRACDGNGQGSEQKRIDELHGVSPVAGQRFDQIVVLKVKVTMPRSLSWDGVPPKAVV